MKITRVCIENFKGINKRVAVDLRPLTLLFGPNSAGKSTILQALQYAREAFLHHNLDVDVTESGAGSFDLGGYRSLLNRSHGGNRIGLRFEMEVAPNELEPQVEEFEHLGAHLAAYVLRFAKFDRAAVTVEVGYNVFQDRVCVLGYFVEIGEDEFGSIDFEPDRAGAVNLSYNPKHPSLIRVRDLAMEGTEDELKNLRDTAGELDDIVLLNLHTEVSNALQYSGDADLMLAGMRDALPDFDLGLLPIVIDEARVDEHIKAQPLRTRKLFLELLKDYVVGLSQLIVGPGRVVRDWFEGLQYLGPIREVPPRDFRTQRTMQPARWSTGLGAWDYLASADDGFLRRVSSWLGDRERLDSGFQLHRKRFKELNVDDPLVLQLLTGRAFDEAEAGARLALDQLPTRSRILLLSREGVEVQPCEVGIGISQVVPVLVTALAGKNRFVALEQPELHIHPRLQAEIADLFIEACRDLGHQFLIETHSEHLILRLLRRIRETSEGDLPEGRLRLQPTDLSVVYLEQTEAGTVATHLQVDETGEFIDRWPHGFFEERAKELF